MLVIPLCVGMGVSMKISRNTIPLSRWLISGAVGLASMSVYGAVATSEGASAATGPVTISYLMQGSPSEVAMYKTYAAHFHALNPGITVQIRNVPFANELSTIRTQSSSSSGPTMSDIYDLWLGQLVQGGLAAKAPQSVVTDVKSHWSAAQATGVTNQGALRGYPNEVDLYALNYNKALFAKAGISAPPKTWAQLTADAKKLTFGAGTQGFGVITGWDSGVVHPWLSLVNSDGGSLLTSSGKANLKSNATLAATTLYKTLVKEGATVPSMSTANAETTGPFLDNFTNGKTAMIIMANWWESDLKSAMGSSFSNIGTAPIPVGPNGKKSSSVSYGWMSIVNAHASSAQQVAAWKFLTWLNDPVSGTGGKSAMGTILMSLGILPSRTSDIAAFRGQLNSPFIKTYVQELPNATPFPNVVPGVQLTDAIQQQVEAVIFGQSSPSAAMAAAQNQAASILQSGN
jgi:multiple sugar transport system substrate-binding protein